MVNFMISKENFVSYLNKIKYFWDIEENVNKAFDGLDFMRFSFCGYEDLLISVLEDAFNDKDGFISWWLYDREFGEHNPNVKVVDKDGAEKELLLNTPEDLYDFLTTEMV